MPWCLENFKKKRAEYVSNERSTSWAREVIENSTPGQSAQIGGEPDAYFTSDFNLSAAQASYVQYNVQG